MERFHIVLVFPTVLKITCLLKIVGANYGGDFTHGFDTQNYPKLQGSLGTQPENTHEIQRQTQPNPYPWIFSGRLG
jgi:microcystin-dependent protein